MFSMTYYEDPGTPALKSVNLSSLNTSRVKDMYGMFSGCELLQAVDLSSFRTARVVDMRNMFFGCSSLKSLDLSTFKTSSVKYLDNMFSGCTGLKKITVSSQWRAVKPGRDMFKDCKRLVGGNGTKYSPKSMGASRAVVDKPGQKGYLALKPAANPMKAKGLMATAKASKLKSKSVTIARSKVIKFKAKPKGKVTYAFHRQEFRRGEGEEGHEEGPLQAPREGDGCRQLGLCVKDPGSHREGSGEVTPGRRRAIVSCC